MIVFSTISAMTSFWRLPLQCCVHPAMYALGYAANDIYGFISWKKENIKKGGQIYVRKF